jgi:O-acetyl-ADP-ribose deacetylase (regulator of RNase III)
MAVIVKTQDITLIENGIIGHGVNCQGVMGSGVARALRDKYPHVYDSYVMFCQAHPTKSERLGLVDFVSIDTDLIVANMITQEFYGRDGKVYACPKAITDTLIWVMNKAKHYKKDIYIPQLGCGLGGLSWSDTVEPIVEAIGELASPINIYVCCFPNK